MECRRKGLSRKSAVFRRADIGVLLSLIVVMIVLLSQFMMGIMAAYVFLNYFGNEAAQSEVTFGGSVIIMVVLSRFVIQPMSVNTVKRESRSSEISSRPSRTLFRSGFIRPA